MKLYSMFIYLSSLNKMVKFSLDITCFLSLSLENSFISTLVYHALHHELHYSKLVWCRV